jgi:hypothetical protein
MNNEFCQHHSLRSNNGICPECGKGLSPPVGWVAAELTPVVRVIEGALRSGKR